MAGGGYFSTACGRCAELDWRFPEWLAAERVAKTQKLLETTDLPIECVAGEARFGTPLSLKLRFGSQSGTLLS